MARKFELFQPAYEAAKKDFAQEEWTDKLSGIEKIVTIARKAPEVLKVDLKEVVKLMLEELKNLRKKNYLQVTKPPFTKKEKEETV